MTHTTLALVPPVDDDRGTPCATCGGIGALMGRWCRRCHPARCTHARADGQRCRSVGACALHAGAARVPGEDMAGTFWTRDEDRWLLALVGEPWPVVAAQLGRSVAAVKGRVAHLRREQSYRGEVAVG